jgi:hypothetical protein
MAKMHSKQTGFSATVILLSVVLVMGIVAFGAMAASRQQINITQSAAITPASPAPNWGTYHDTGYAAASGISMKYPPDWKINIPGVRAIGNTKTRLLLSTRESYSFRRQKPLKRNGTPVPSMSLLMPAAPPLGTKH